MSTKNSSAKKPFTLLENGNIQFKLIILWSDIERMYENKLIEAISQTEIPGFRKGKAPRNLVEPKLDRSDLISKALNELLPKAYTEFINANNLKPILYPQIKIDKGEEKENWEFTILTCETPTITLPDYKKGLSAIKPKPDQSKISACIEYLKTNCKIKIPDMLVEEETNHRLSSLIENISQIGLNLEKYLQTKKMSSEDLKTQTAQMARQDLEIEFILADIQTHEKLPSRDKVIEYIQSLVPSAK